MYVLAITNQKGGTAKTTTAVTLAHGLALAGTRVLLCDLDAQGNCADALGLKKRGGLYALLFGGSDPVTDTGRENLAAVLGDHSTVEAKQRLSGQSFREYALRDALSKLQGFDVAILDVAPGVDILQIGAFVACTAFLIPVALDHLAVVGAGDALSTIASLKQVGAFKGQFLGILPTFWERTTRESHEQLEIIAKEFASLVWPPVPLDVKAREAPSYGQTLWEYAPGTRALAGAKINGTPIGGYAQVLARLQREIGL